MPGFWSERSRNGGVDEVPLPFGPGRLWLCGKHFIGPDPEAALERVGASTAVCLTEAHELEARYPAYVTWLREVPATRAVWFPIHDLHAPGVDQVLPLLADLRARIEAGRGLLVHCGAGIGRAGTIAAALLVSSGVPVHDALATVRASRAMAGPEVGPQRRLVEAVAAAC